MSLLTNKLSKIIHFSWNNNLNRVILPLAADSLQVRNYAARKGTRERKRKAKVQKVEVPKVGFIPHNLKNRDKILAARPIKKFDDSWKRDPIDDVFAMKYYKWIVYPFAEAIKCHRQTHHPTMYNMPNAPLNVTIELNMQGEKKTRFIDNFKRIAAVPHPFDHGEDRAIIAFAKNPESIKEAKDAGASLAGGVDLIKQIQNGQVHLNDFQYSIAHPDILPELVVLRGIMKRKFPNAKNDTLTPLVGKVVSQFVNGISYQALKDEYEKDFGQIEATLGTLDMDEKHLEENFAALINDVNTQKPKRAGGFINRCILWSPPSRETLKIDHEQYLTATSEPKKEEKNQEDAQKEDDEEEEVKEGVVTL
ncbi:39S ribosomal protein L1, mitochondrial [Anthonomus grandis grandis]|uniref:39S ribosomal protein L1, mitochondrial n=1 Tax=Anthonomus grandis grandis TaxID=2921223 RepID=UPI002165C05C|nr:39S ribosomal protein L1, mitochondrial [Anthonomus grandis grandis]